MLQAGLAGLIPVIVTLILAIEILKVLSLTIAPERSTGWSKARTMGLGPAISTDLMGPPVETVPLPVEEPALIHAYADTVRVRAPRTATVTMPTLRAAALVAGTRTSNIASPPLTSGGADLVAGHARRDPKKQRE
ncbi:hypothetical protein Adu01nite_47950 [Paractinoplanes durhamensis]|uniref:Uncharacterized protein n=1 Tax=Paractinoplanes durhamensis TaxID=113563 RepID=A0ABQ3Z0Y8_9ACTN|nr:hypothetical protein Adu01nite_47950 [Actinoplanes durhamensis]